MFTKKKKKRLTECCKLPSLFAKGFPFALREKTNKSDKVRHHPRKNRPPQKTSSLFIGYESSEVWLLKRPRFLLSAANKAGPCARGIGGSLILMSNPCSFSSRRFFQRENETHPKSCSLCPATQLFFSTMSRRIQILTVICHFENFFLFFQPMPRAAIVPRRTFSASAA